MENLTIDNSGNNKTRRRYTKSIESFAKLWANSISGEELVEQAHKHIEDLYSDAGKQ